MENKNVLDIRDLSVSIAGIPFLNRISFKIPEGATVGIVGESGCGKTTLIKSIMRLNDAGVSVTQGKIMFFDKELLSMPLREWNELRGNDISFIFQNAQSALDPMMKVGKQVAKALLCHKKVSHREAEERAVMWMKRVGITDAEKRMGSYPHELSGGQCQRICLAMAMINMPRLVIADEPTTALDVVTEAGILDLIKNLRGEFHTSFLIVSHNIGTLARLCDRVCVMAGGNIVETVGMKELLDRPAHPYSAALLSAYHSLRHTPDSLYSIPGNAPSVREITGCPFYGRCEKATDICRLENPEEKRISEDHFVRCHRVTEDKRDE